MVDYIKLDEREFLYFLGGKKKEKEILSTNDDLAGILRSLP